MNPSAHSTGLALQGHQRLLVLLGEDLPVMPRLLELLELLEGSAQKAFLFRFSRFQIVGASEIRARSPSTQKGKRTTEAANTRSRNIASLIRYQMEMGHHLDCSQRSENRNCAPWNALRQANKRASNHAKSINQHTNTPASQQTKQPTNKK